MALVIVGAVVSAGWLWWDSRGLEEEASRYEQAKQRVLEINRRFVEQASLAGINVSEGRINSLPREVAFANQLLEKRAFSWTRFLSDLEEAVPPRISISSVTLNFKDKTITLNGMALTLKDLTALVAGLESHPAFKEVVLSQHRLQEDDAEAGPAAGHKEKAETIDFSLSVAYRLPS
jgi:Tfp pilus assembly protein PilN